MLKPMSVAVTLFLLGAAALAPAETVAPEPNLRMTNDVRVYQLVKDAVVNISSSRIVAQRVSSGDPVFDRFFGGQIQMGPATSLGSGFVIHPSGYIITNEHVVDEATEVEVMFSDGTKLPAQVIATDNEHDLAVLKVEPKKPLQAISLGASETLMIGEPVYAIGNPLGYAGTMTRGIVSAVDRTLEAGPNKKYTGLIQTDASINPGNSGGPLLNAYAQVVGINTAIRADAHGIGFAIAVSNMRDLLPAFLNSEAVNKAQVGFTIEEHRGEKAPATVESAIYVKQVQAGSPAEKAGVRAGDRVMAVGGQSVNNVVDALVAIGSAKAGETLDLRVSRAGGTTNTPKSTEIKIVVTKMPPGPTEDILLAKLGVKAETVTAAMAAKRRLAVRQGILITAVQADSPAGASGLQPGDVLVQLGRYYVTTVEDVATLLKSVDRQLDVPIGIVRGNSRGRGTVTLK